MMEAVHAYTDGACSPNPGVGGWGVVLVYPTRDGDVQELSGGEMRSTNNRMELMAAVEALRVIKSPSLVKVVTDSQYVVKAFTDGWLDRWRENGWRTAAKKPVQNADLWRVLAGLASTHHVEWVWVKGHAGHPMNERADALAVAARRRVRASS